MNINSLPYEVLCKILEETAKLNQQYGPSYTFGLTQTVPMQKPALQRYVRGPVPPEMLKWDATSSIRKVCWQWHEWALEYALRDVYIRRWKGGERWAELSNRRESYGSYELITKPTGTAVYRDPFSSLKRTVQTFSDFPHVASKVRRMFFHGFYYAKTDEMIFDALRNCSNLTSVSLPWTTLRHLDAKAWRQLLVGNAAPLQSLELLAVDPTAKQAADPANQVDLRPLESPHANFSQLRRLKVFGDTTFMPITDRDLFAIARTATRLEEFHLTCISTVTIAGVMAVIKASQSTLRVLEHSPRSNDGFYHPHPGTLSEDEHICEILTSCPKLETVSLSVPSVCAKLFSNEDVRWSGDLQVRALHLCGYEDGRSTFDAQDALQKLLHQSRRLIKRRAESTFPKELYVELFFADFIFEPHAKAVHGDFGLAELASGGSWPETRAPSRKGPYGSTGLYGKDEEEPFERVDEDEFLAGARRNAVSISV